MGNDIVQVLQNPSDLVDADGAELTLLLRQALGTQLLGVLAARVREAGLRDQVPEKLLDRLHAACKWAEIQQRMSRWEVDRLKRALQPLNVPIVLLKGAAYIESGLPISLGRMMSDVDILVPRDRLKDVESALLQGGWRTKDLTEYDEKYYRAWMHELPPFSHPARGLVVDVHHNILPLTSRIKVPPGPLIARSLAVSDADANLRMLCPEHMVLHLCAHLFHDGDFSNGMRQVVDLDGMLRYFGKQEDFWRNLLEQSEKLGLGRPLFYGLYFSQTLLRSPVPNSVFSTVRRFSPPMPWRPLVLELMRRALVPPEPDSAHVYHGFAKWLLYLRSHWLRMSPLLLVRHLATKAVMRARNPAENA